MYKQFLTYMEEIYLIFTIYWWRRTSHCKKGNRLKIINICEAFSLQVQLECSDQCLEFISKMLLDATPIKDHLPKKFMMRRG